MGCANTPLAAYKNPQNHHNLSRSATAKAEDRGVYSELSTFGLSTFSRRACPPRFGSASFDRADFAQKNAPGKPGG